jgi:hypothetical protein
MDRSGCGSAVGAGVHDRAGALAYDHFPEVRDFVENLPLVFNDLVRR